MNLATNRQACSRDIGKMYAKHQTLKYVINGGSWGNNRRFVNIMIMGAVWWPIVVIQNFV